MSLLSDKQIRELQIHAKLDSDLRTTLRTLILDYQRLRKMEDLLAGDDFADRLEEVFVGNDSWDWDLVEGTRPATLNREVITDKIINLVKEIATT